MDHSRLFGMLLVAFIFCPVTNGQQEGLDLCDVISRPRDFDGKRITVKASYRYGFEWQEIYCLRCRESAQVWLEIPTELPKAVQRSLNGLPKNQGTVNAVFTGVFQGSGSAFGDGSYPYRLVLGDLDRIRVVSRSGTVPAALEAAERAKLCPCTSERHPR